MLPSFAMAQNDDILRAEKYLQNLETLQADFIQRSSLGARLSGQFYLDRPGKLRFDYNEVDDFVVADGFFIYFYDGALKQQSNAPIGQTLADFLLRKDISLSDELIVQDIKKEDGFTRLMVVQKADPTSGSVELIFSDIPYALKKWRVTDPTGETTEIEIKNVQRDVNFENGLFAYFDPESKKRDFNN